MANGLENIGQLVRPNGAELRRIQNLGGSTLAETQRALCIRGLALGTSLQGASAYSRFDKQRSQSHVLEAGSELVEPVRVALGATEQRAREYRQLPVTALNLSVRAENCLKAKRIERVVQLLQLGEMDLLRLPNLGKRTVREIIEALDRYGLSLGMSLEKAQASFRCDEQSSIPNAAEVAVGQGAPLSERPGTAELRVAEYLRKFSSREKGVLTTRVFRSTRTLEELGQQFNVTRERIRQVEKQLTGKLVAYLDSPEGAPAHGLASRLRADLGRAIPEAGLEEFCRARVSPFLPQDDDSTLMSIFLLWAAGPYVRKDGWMVTADFQTNGTVEAVRERIDERGWIPPPAAYETLLNAGVHEKHHSAWLMDHGFVPVGDGWWPRQRSIPDRVEQILRYRGEPVTADELYPLVGCESERSLRNRLFDDRRFKKTSRQGHFALREWTQYDEYTGIAEEIAEEIQRQGGTVVPRHLIEVLSKRYGVKPSSVYQYLSAPMFIKERDGRVRLRTSDELLSVQANPSDCAGLYRINGKWMLRVEINAETLRGSGRPLRAAVALVAGCQPGGRRVFRSPTDEIVVSWPAGSASGPNLGSLKPDLESLGGRVGDLLFLTLGGSSIDVRVLKAEQLEGVSPLTKLSLLVGVSPSVEGAADPWVAIASAIGLSSREGVADPEDIHARLMQRNEVLLAQLVREARPHAIENILDRLEGDLGL